MAEEQEEVHVAAYVLGFIVVAVSSVAVASHWLNVSPAPMAAVVGGFAGTVGVAQRQSIFQALVCVAVSAWAILVIVTLAWFLGYESVIAAYMVPAAVGVPTGMFMIGVWKAMLS